MKTIRELNIKDWSGYFFTNTTNINDIDPNFFLLMILKTVEMAVEYCLT